MKGERERDKQVGLLLVVALEPVRDAFGNGFDYVSEWGRLDSDVQILLRH